MSRRHNPREGATPIPGRRFNDDPRFDAPWLDAACPNQFSGWQSSPDPDRGRRVALRGLPGARFPNGAWLRGIVAELWQSSERPGIGWLRT
jgi:hypothetical protein